MVVLSSLVLASSAAAIVFGGVRWLRVAQREHYLGRPVLRFVRRWWGRDPLAVVTYAIGLAGAVVCGFVVSAGFATALVVATGPSGLGLRGRTSRLVWTRRLRTVAALATVVAAGLVVIPAALVGTSAGAVAATACAAAVPLVVVVGLVADRPIERAVTRRYLARASARLDAVAPLVVAITGSYGKTSTKRYVAHLLEGSRVVFATPASFNNLAGLTRAVNESLTQGTEVFVAELGAYGRGEIARLVSWLHPRVSVITAIGPVHLERFGSLEVTLAAKSEILEGAETAVLNVDDPLLGPLAERLRAAGRRVVACSTTKLADVGVIVGESSAQLYCSSELVGEIPLDPSRPLAAGNVACAAGAALAVGVSPSECLRRLSSLPAVEHRLDWATSSSGVVVLDDTYNSNPAGVRLALTALAGAGSADARRAVVTPGMVELGRRQADENRAFARRAAEVASDLVVVATTNKAALVAGYDEAVAAGARANLVVVERREEAVSWVRDTLVEGDAVLYENDLPDHYP